jgi:fermentation-respiration switch protein FrsA (DUF1100 family)
MADNGVAPTRRKAVLRRILSGIAGVLVLAYAAACVLLYFQQDHMVFPGPPQHYKATSPADAGLAFEDMHIPVNASDQIHAWWIPAASPSSKVLLYFHGNGYCIEQTAGAIEEVGALHSLGANVLMADYIGYGASSPGQANEQRVYEGARAALDYLTGQRKIPIHDIVMVGRSIGTGPATELAKENPNAAALILVSAFTSVTDLANTIWYVRLMPLSLMEHNPMNNLAKIGAVHIPAFLTVGSEDTLTPPAMAQALLAKANDPKRLFIVLGADHNAMFKIGVKEMTEQMRSFLQTIH